MESEHVLIGNIKDNFDRVEDILDNYLFRIGITGKNNLRFTLLSEEALRLARSIVEDDSGIEIWFEGNDQTSYIYLRIEGRFDANKEEEFVSISSSGTNSSQKTFFDELKTFFVKPQKPTWSLVEYTKELNEKKKQDKFAQESWDNLERSVIANLADDIVVQVKDGIVSMTITKIFNTK